mmetsp:Transcript_53356/g.121488  ORF Transcript_53356/g.121488 Transcript_53356/m.121488 type:complete len:242 (-) Transcript_53356:15-740(-)
MLVWLLLFWGLSDGLASWAGSAAEVPSVEACRDLDGVARIYHRKIPPVSLNQKVEGIFPGCAVGGSTVRVEVYLSEYNDGEIGLGNANCVEKPELIQPLNDTWVVFWYLVYPGTYAICYAPDGSTEFIQQGVVHLLEPDVKNCDMLRNSSLTNQTHGQIQCAFPVTQPLSVFDGFTEETIPKPSQCMPDCAACRAVGGACRCLDETELAEDRKTTASCEDQCQQCPPEDAGFCTCVKAADL